MMNLPPVKKMDAAVGMMLKHNPKKADDFEGLLNATKTETVLDTVIQGVKVRLVPNCFSERDLFSLYLNDTQSNSCLGGAMRKLIREWQAGQREVQVFPDGMTLLMKK